MDITELKAIIDANIFENTSQAITGDALNDVLNLIADSLGEYVPVADIFDESGTIRSALLPSYVDDVLEFSTRDAFPAVGEGGKIYLATDTNLSYRWGGSEYVIIAQSLALGETSSTAYRGDRGKIAYDHSQTSHRLSIAGLEVSALGGSIETDALASALSIPELRNAVVTHTGNSTIHITAAERIAWNKIASYFYIDEQTGNLVTDRNVIIRKNLTVGGDTSTGGKGEDTGVSGTVTGIRVDANTILEPTNGIVDMSDVLANIDVDLSDYYTKQETTSEIAKAVNDLNLGQYAKASELATLQRALGGKQDALGYTPVNKAGDTINGNLTIDGYLYGPKVGDNPRNRYDSALYFFNCNIATTSVYNFGLYQWNNEFEFTFRNSATNSYSGTAFTIQGSNGQVDFSKRPTVKNVDVALASDVATLQTEVDNIEAVLGMDEEAADIINTWEEVKAFLDGYSSSDDLATILSVMNADIAKRALVSDLDALARRVGVNELAIADNAGNIKNNFDAIKALGTSKADKATTLAGYGITDAYTEDEIDGKVTAINNAIALKADTTALEALALTVGDNATNIRNLKASVYTKDDLAAYKSWWDDLMGFIVKEGNNIKIKTNLIIAGDTTTGGTGSDAGTSGTVIGVVVNGQSYKDETNGMLDLSTLMNQYALTSAIPSLEGYAKIADVSAALAGYQPLITASNKLDYSLIANTPSLKSLAFKDSLAVSEVVGLQSALSNKQDALGYTPVNKAGDTLTGTLVRTDNASPVIKVYGDIDFTILDIKDAATSTGFGFELNYLGSGTNNNNKLTLVADNKNGTKVTAFSLTQDGVFSFAKVPNVSGNTIYHSGNLTKSTLGLGNVENKSSATIRGELTTSDVTKALGYTPYNTANISGASVAYASSAGNADTLEGQHASYFATASSLGNYLPLGGGNVGYLQIANTPENSCYLQIEQVGANINYISIKAIDRNGSHPNARPIVLQYGEGNVGINTPVPVYKLDVNGSFNATSGYINDNTIYHSGNCNNASTPWNASSLTLNGAITGVTNITASGNATIAGNVGIGTTSPSYKLDVNGEVRATGFRFDGDSNRYTKYGQSVNMFMPIADGWAGGLNWYTNSGNSLFALGYFYDRGYDNDFFYFGYGASHTNPVNVMRPNGNIGIGTKSPSAKLHIVGNAIITGDTATGSDIRFKDVIKDHRIALKSIAQAPLFTFKWNDREDDTIHLGTSAQYWEGIAPWLVKGTDFKVLDYSTLGVAIGISLANKTVNLEERVKILEKENEQLKKQIYGS